MCDYLTIQIHHFIVIPPSPCIFKSSVILRVADVSTPLQLTHPPSHSVFSLCGKGSGWRGGTEADSGASG